MSKPKLSILQKLILVSSIVLVINGVIGYAVYKSNQKLRDSVKLVEHTEEVIILSGNILSLGKDLEGAARGFVITNDTGYLPPLVSAEKTIFQYIAQLRQLTRDNQVQQWRVDSLSIYMHHRLDFSLNLVDIRRDQGFAAAHNYMDTKSGKLYSAKIREIIKEIQYEENLLLIQRKETNEFSVTTFNGLIAGMFILMSAFTIFLVIAIGKNLNKDKEKEKRAAELIVVNKELVCQHEETDKQEVANKELEAFSYSVSHDLRAPLRHIGGFIDLLVKNNSAQLDETGLRYLNIISESSLEMGVLIDALLTFSRLSRTELQRSKINSNNLVARVLKTFSDELNGRKVEINVSELPDTNGDESLISQVWVNLISNALKYSRNTEKAVIDIGGKIESDQTIFFIRDNGAGFDMKYVQKLFGVFQRLHKARDFEGIGIGLANVNRIILRHGGACWAEGEVGAGATFFFSLPNNYQPLNK